MAGIETTPVVASRVQFTEDTKPSNSAPGERKVSVRVFPMKPSQSTPTFQIKVGAKTLSADGHERRFYCAYDYLSYGIFEADYFNGEVVA